MASQTPSGVGTAAGRGSARPDRVGRLDRHDLAGPSALAPAGLALSLHIAVEMVSLSEMSLMLPRFCLSLARVMGPPPHGRPHGEAR